MKKLFFLIAVIVPFMLTAQKNMTTVAQTKMLGLPLPAGSKKDGRMLSVSAAKILLEMESKKAGTTIKNTEVYMLPSVKQSGYTSDSLVGALSSGGFELAGVEGDDKYAWAQKNGIAYMVYFSTDVNEINLYVGECANWPSVFQQTHTQTVSNNSSYQTPPAQSAQPSQQVNTGTIQGSPPQQLPPAQHQPPPSSTTTVRHSGNSTTGNSFQFSTSNFDDGWNSSIQNDWVLVEKGDAKVYLYYAVPYNSDHFTGTGVRDRDYYWDNYVAKQFNISTKQYKDDGEFVSSLQPKYVEGVGADPQTGQTRFIAMSLAIAPNAAQLTVASYPDESSFRQAFPRANDKYVSDLMNMNRYNKFAIGSGDLTGTWQSGGSQMTQWYDALTGNYAGATIAASSATFIFSPDGSYTSIHNGATGAVGAMNTFQQEYKGSCTVSNWSIVATNRYQGKTENFDSHFQAVKGGRLLYMNDNKGGSYLLVKIR